MKTRALAGTILVAGVLAACSAATDPTVQLSGAASPTGADGGPIGTGGSTNPGGSGGSGDPTTGGAADAGARGEKALTIEDVFHELPSGAEQMKVLCARGGTNKLTAALCGATPPTVTSLKELQAALGLAFTSTQTGRGNNGQNGNPGFALAGHSSSLVARFTTAINPRAIVFTPPTGNAVPNLVALGFVRGEQFAEVIARDPEKNELRFFLVSFKQACNATGSCTPGDLLTPAIEKSWTSYTVYEDVDIKNTVLDCTQCHQTAGSTTPKVMRFQELQNPWTHMFRDNTPGGQALLADFHGAHGTTEDYGPIPAAQVNSSDPANLEDLIRDNGFGTQPNEFQTSRIEQEVRNSSAAQPQSNATPGTSATWQGLYDKFAAGTVIAPPYHDVKVTDPTKLSTMTAAYQQFLSGQLTAKNLPDIRNAFLDSQAWAMGFGAKPGLNGRQIMTQMCQSCHKPELDQTISRAKFDVVKLDQMSREEKDKAIERIRLPKEHLLAMPPTRFRDLTAAEIELVAAELKK